MSSKADEIKLDIEELQSLVQQAQRQKSKDILSLEVKKLQAELTKISDTIREADDKSAVKTAAQNTGPKCYEVKLNNYGWDQSDNFVKLYVTLKNVQTLPEGAAYCEFTERSIDLHVLGLENRNYQLPIHNLCEIIDTKKSYIKVKTDMVVIFLAKKVQKQWSHVTGVEKRIKEASTALPQNSEDAQSAGADLMSIMKKMYQDGDDDLKKIMAKAWTESQGKKPGFRDFSSL